MLTNTIDIFQYFDCKHIHFLQVGFECIHTIGQRIPSLFSVALFNQALQSSKPEKLYASVSTGPHTAPE